jgi:hypothetical protein
VDLDVAALSEVVRRVLDVALTLADEQQAFVGQVASEMAGLMIGLPDPERVSGLRSRQRTYAENVEIVTGLVRWVDDSTSLIAA